MNKALFLLFIIVLMGTFLRFYRLGEIPVGFHRDEAFLGYNAYSILKTAKDMSNNFLPLHLKSFLYSPAGYSYFSIPFIKFFDLNPFSVRFASAFFGSLTVAVTYLLVLSLFSYLRNPPPRSPFDHLGGDQNGLPRGESFIALLSSFLIAISPWHINLSRTATENTIVVFFITLGVLLYLLWVNSNRMIFLLLSFFSFAITLFLYQAPRAFLPFFLPLLIILFASRLKRWISFIGFAIILVPLFFILSSKNLSLRINTVSIFSTPESQLVITDHVLTDGVYNIPLVLTRLFHNKPLAYSAQFLDNYFSHFSYQFLFTDKGFPDRYRVPLSGLLYVVELPLIIFGIFKLLSVQNRLSPFLLGWIVLAPLGSALTFDDVPNLQRTLIMLPALYIVEAFGILHVVLFFRAKKFLRVVGSLAVIVFLFNISLYIHQYYVHSSLYRPWYRQDGYSGLVKKVNALLPWYKKVIVTNRESAPAIFFLFYGKYNPLHFQLETKKTTMVDFDRINFGKYEFSQEECPLRLIEKDGKIAAREKDVLYVNSGLCKIPSNVKVLGSIRRADNSLVFSILSDEKN